MRLDLQTTIPKRLDEPNEDVWETLPFRHRYALSDGATESFASRHWAREVVSTYLKRQVIDRDWLRHATACYKKCFDREAMTWSTQAAFDRGSFATLLGLTLDIHRQAVRVLAIGDSLAVLADGDRLVATFPYQHAKQFQQRPLLLATHMGDNTRLLVPGVLDRATVQWSWRGFRAPVLLLMTDALGAWLLTNPLARLPLLLRLKTRVNFAQLIHTERCCGRLRHDDTTLLRIQ